MLSWFILPLLAFLAAAGIAAALYFANAPELHEDPVFEGDASDLPAGAGSAPDGPADMERGGLTTGTDPASVIDQTIDSDNVGALLQHEGGEEPAAPSAEGLAPFGQDADPILPQIADETEMTVPGTEDDGAADETQD